MIAPRTEDQSYAPAITAGVFVRSGTPRPPQPAIVATSVIAAAPKTQSLIVVPSARASSSFEATSHHGVLAPNGGAW
jgi:hypothetical protein